MLSLTLLALFVSTTVYIVFNLLWAREYIAYVLDFESGDYARSIISLAQTCNCAKTATLTINVLVMLPCFRSSLLIRLSQIILGDAIVCWRAYVVWKGNKFIMGASVVFLLATFGT